jgi:hypothetical protein
MFSEQFPVMESAERWLLESPWPVSAAMALAAAVLAFRSRESTNPRRLLLAALACATLAVAVQVLAWAVQTPRELLTARTLRLVEATAPFDGEALRPLFDPKGLMTGPDGDFWLDLGEMVTKVGAAVKSYGIDSNRVRESQAVASRDRGRVFVRVQTLVGGRPLYTEWLVFWEQRAPSRGADGWVVTQVQWQRINGETPVRGRW